LVAYGEADVKYKEPKMTVTIRIANYAGSVICKVQEEKQMLKTPVDKKREKKTVGSPKQNGLDEVTGDKETQWECGKLEELVLAAKTVDGV
jgi:hypothetical protein